MCEGKCECVYVSVWISFINFLVSGHPCGADTAVGLEREKNLLRTFRKHLEDCKHEILSYFRGNERIFPGKF